QAIPADNDGFMAIFKSTPHDLIASSPFDPPESDDPSYWWGQAKNMRALLFQTTRGLFNIRHAYKEAVSRGTGLSGS
ncbi:hypothetical protein NAI77_10700, partial [Francisella tularensis subsp. holarctica]|nr:hypothetical protein [Francisella tularensis subsp. holarctica]